MRMLRSATQLEMVADLVIKHQPPALIPVSSGALLTSAAHRGGCCSVADRSARHPVWKQVASALQAADSLSPRTAKGSAAAQGAARLSAAWRSANRAVPRRRHSWAAGGL
jgi:hypothetical protein